MMNEMFRDGRWQAMLTITVSLALCACGGCRTAREHRDKADAAANTILSAAQTQAFGRTEPIETESPVDTFRRRLLLNQNLPVSGPASLGMHDLPDTAYWEGPEHLKDGASPSVPWASDRELKITLTDALQISARSSRDYQDAKDTLFRSALALDLESDEYRTLFSGKAKGGLNHDRSGEEPVSAADGSAALGVTRTLMSGVEISGGLVLDMVQLLTQETSSSLGLYADASISIPLLRGAGRKVAMEPLKQAERNVLYAVYEFERFKRTFAVRVTSEYLSVLSERQQVSNAKENYRRLIASCRRARRLADAGRLPEFQYDQAVQDELRARTRWIQAQQRYATRLDSLRTLLGLPPDARIEPDPAELDTLQTVAARFGDKAAALAHEEVTPSGDGEVALRAPDNSNAGPLELDPQAAVQQALTSRLDLLIAASAVEDAQRGVYVAKDGLRAELTLLANGQAGGRRTSAASAGLDDAQLRPDRGSYAGLLSLDLPFNRTRERIAYRNALLKLEQAVRTVQETEDRVKLDVRGALRALRETRENVLIQLEAIRLAEKRVHSTDLFLQAGRAQIRDVLESQEALLNAQNALTSAVVSYRVAELALQRDMGVLEVTVDGLCKEYAPEE